MKSLLFGCSIFLYKKMTASNSYANQSSLPLTDKFSSFKKPQGLLFSQPTFLYKGSSVDMGAKTCMQKGQEYLAEEKYNEAIPYFKKSLELLEETQTVEAQLLSSNCQFAIGEAYFALDKVNEALERYRSSLDHIKHNENNSKMLGEIYEKLGLAHISKKEHKAALDYFMKTLKIKEEQMPEDVASIADITSHVSKAYFEMGNTSKSLEYYNKSIDLLKKPHLTKEDYSVLKTRVNLLPLQYVLKKYKDCEENLKNAEESVKRFKENANALKKKADADEISIKFWKGGLKLALEQSDEAFDCYKAALDLSLKHYGEFHPKFQTLYANVYKIHFIAGKKFERFNSKA